VTEAAAAPLAGAVALVTGASRGIGAAVAVELARLGAHLVLTARGQGGLEETDDAIRAAGIGEATLLPLDLLREAEKLDMLGPSVVQRFGRLDILVHAAGVLSKLTPVAHIQPRDWQESVAVNLSACWRLIRSCDPPLRAAPAGRAVVLTDAVASAPRAYWGLYGAAKAGQEHLVRSWAAEVARTPLRVALFDPGPVATQLRAVAMPGENPATLRKPAEVAPAVAALCLPGEAPPHGAVVRAADRATAV
jgi:NAD(P)-dependent dehydrogenase (short-subunit alcohol dehydrogenase family)